VAYYTRWWYLTFTGFLLFLLVPCGHAEVSVNLPLDDPAYPLLDKLVTSNLTFTNALTLKPITRLYAARLIAEAIEQRRHELDTTQRQEPFLDEMLEYLASRFKRELQEIGFLYRPRRAASVFLAPLAEVKLDTVFARNQFVLRDSSGLTPNLQGVFGLNEGFAYGNDFTLRARSISWMTLVHHFAAYLEPEVSIRSHPLLDDTFEAGLHKGYLKASYINLELAFGRDTLWWGPASQGDLVISNNAPPFDLVKFTTPQPFRLPGPYHALGEWQIAYFVARLEAQREFPHALLSGLRLTFQPATLVKVGFTNAFQAFGSGGVGLSALEYLEKLFVPTLDTTGRTVNGLVAYDVVLSVPFVRELPFLEGLKLYWQRGQDNVKNIQGVLGGGNILGAVLEGGRWDVRFEFVETRDARSVWYTHPTYRSGFALKQFVIGHPIGGAAQGFFGRATYYLTPTAWIAADGRHEQYGFETQSALTTQQRFGLEASYQFPWQQRYLTLGGRVEYATLEAPGAASERTVNIQLSTRWRF
jgi:Capsule assembly protein Wzi